MSIYFSDMSFNSYENGAVFALLILQTRIPFSFANKEHVLIEREKMAGVPSHFGISKYFGKWYFH